ncbi:MAG TPA: hypothetical protein PK185_11330 [Cyclobacteriaceae bacterium]|nr:hypothetical protein [Cyclobacteriaceae bacterium]
MSHVKNADAYSRLVGICTGYGGTYNPGRQTLQLKAMRALLEAVQSSLRDVSQKRNALSGITNERIRAYKNLDLLIGRIIGTLKASQVDDDTLANVRYYTRLITGRMKAGSNRPAVTGEDNDAESLIKRALTQQSYVAKAFNFMRLAQLIEKVPGYATAAADLQPSALMKEADRLMALNEAWSKAKVALANARIHRDTLLYKGVDSLHSNALAVKSYLRVEFGSQSQQAAQLSELSFTKRKIR